MDLAWLIRVSRSARAEASRFPPRRLRALLTLETSFRRLSFPRCAGGVDYLVRMGVGGSMATGSAVAWLA
ncbi:hypothetical protein ACIRST_41950, partial [Kitasatospora sp. NPDC101447]|uniref:hypothetical protein n=1 Tax=Kitasatospora sp. NPDC101447 TaxID=3364102 RepID=UPI0037F2D23D